MLFSMACDGMLLINADYSAYELIVINVCFNYIFHNMHCFWFIYLFYLLYHRSFNGSERNDMIKLTINTPNKIYLTSQATGGGVSSCIKQSSTSNHIPEDSNGYDRYNLIVFFDTAPCILNICSVELSEQACSVILSRLIKKAHTSRFTEGIE